MSVTSRSRGHKIYYDGKAWRYSDNGNLLQDEARPCICCGKHPTPEGHDACIGYIEGVDSACCGHGVTERIEQKPCACGGVPTFKKEGREPWFPWYAYCTNCLFSPPIFCDTKKEIIATWNKCMKRSKG
jgi:hypothetical protein